MTTKLGQIENKNLVEDLRCLACLNQYSKHQLFPIHSKNVLIDSSDEALAEVYYQCTQLTIEEETGGAGKWICENCTEKLVHLFSFRKMCINSYNIIKVSNERVVCNDEIKEEVIDCGEIAIDYGDLGNVKIEIIDTAYECDEGQSKDVIDETVRDEIAYNRNEFEVQRNNSDEGGNVISYKTEIAIKKGHRNKHETDDYDDSEIEFEVYIS